MALRNLNRLRVTICICTLPSSDLARVISFGGGKKLREVRKNGGPEVRRIFGSHALQNIGKRSFLEEHPKMRNEKVLALDYLVRKLTFWTPTFLSLGTIAPLPPWLRHWVQAFKDHEYIHFKRTRIYNLMILTNFNYCPLIWLLCNKNANKIIDRVHKRALMILRNDHDSSFQLLH